MYSHFAEFVGGYQTGRTSRRKICAVTGPTKLELPQSLRMLRSCFRLGEKIGERAIALLQLFADVQEFRRRGEVIADIVRLIQQAYEFILPRTKDRIGSR